MQKTSPYANAKACGIISKSFVGGRISLLTGLNSLSELNRLVFQEQQSDLAGREILSVLERKIIARSVRQILVILNGFSKPPELIVRLLRIYEYNDLKMCIQNIAYGVKSPPQICNLGRFATVRFNLFPDITAMLKNTEFEFLLEQELKSIQSGRDTTPVETKLDSLYYNNLVESLSHISLEDQIIISRILYDEISLRNCAWALRLRTYFNKGAEETAKYLMNIKLRDKTGKNVSLAGQALQSCGYPLDMRASWEGWKWEKLLNAEDAHTHWKADPRYFQNAAAQYLYRQTMKSFHRLPMSVSAVFCYIKLKQFEEDLLTSIAEGLSLGIDSTNVFKLLEAAP